MKKVILTILLFIMLLPFVVKASSCDINSVTIESITLEDSTGNASEKNQATIEENKINLNLSMLDVGDSITYKIDVRNDSEDDMEINKDSFNVSDSEYIKYTLNDENSVLVEANSTKVVFLKIEYHNEVPDSVMGENGYKEEEDLTLSLSSHDDPISEIIDPIIDIINPKTGDIRATIVFWVLVVSSIIYLIVHKKKPLTMVIIGMLLIIPIMSYAACEIEFNIKANIEISRLAEFDKGIVVNNKMNLLSNGMYNIYDFKRSNTLPDNIRSLVEEELTEAANVSISDEEIDSEVSRYDYSYLMENFIVKEENGEKYYCTRNLEYDSEYCYSRNDFVSYSPDLTVYRVQKENSETIDYLVYIKELNEIRIMSLNQFKEFIRVIKTDDRKNTIKKNIFSSDESDYLIYGWFDDNKIYYYCEKDEVYLNKDSSSMFKNLTRIANTNGIEELNTSRVQSMKSMFYQIGNYQSNLELDLSNWDTSKVTNMSRMFESFNDEAWYASYNSFKLNLSNWDTSKVEDMSSMFYDTGIVFNNTTIEGLSNWDVSNVTNMSGMFYSTGRFSTVINISDISNWNTSKVTNMYEMFSWLGQEATNLEINLSSWDVSKVENMNSMFYGTGSNSTTWSIGDLSNWNTSKVTDMQAMFSYSGNKATTWSIGDISNWDVSNVETMYQMFSGAGFTSNIWNIGNLSNWNTSKVTNMYGMFQQAGYNAESVELNLSGWDTSNVQYIDRLFYQFGFKANNVIINASGFNLNNCTYFRETLNQLGYNANTVKLNLSSWSMDELTDFNFGFPSIGGNSETIELNLSNWNIPKVTTMSSAFSYFGSNANSIKLDLTNWNLSNTQSLYYMFYSAGQNAITFIIDGLSTWDTSSVTTMYGVFDWTGRNATTWSIGDLSSWNVSNVTNMAAMFAGAGEKATAWSIGNLTNWDTSKVTDMGSMFSNAGKNSENIIDIGSLNIYADNIYNFMRNCPNIKATINLYHKPTNVSYAFDGAATKEGSGIVINYTSEVTNIDSLVSGNPKIVKGELLD